MHKSKVRKKTDYTINPASRPPVKVKAKEELLREVASDEWWEDVTVDMLEHARRELRSIVGLLDKKKRVVV
ncbi:hypothetical protein, partial [Nocardia farcinica]|uniref:hypothetical protein n=1 Tax=Nocardia farcinica TaxID=37329 RepID=UPI002453CDE1